MRESIEPTYGGDARYHVTTWMGDELVGQYRQPLMDPFATTTVRIGFWDALWSLIRQRSITIRVVLDGDPEIVEDVLELNSDYNGQRNSTRRMARDLQFHDALARM